MIKYQSNNIDRYLSQLPRNERFNAMFYKIARNFKYLMTVAIQQSRLKDNPLAVKA